MSKQALEGANVYAGAQAADGEGVAEAVEVACNAGGLAEGGPGEVDLG